MMKSHPPRIVLGACLLFAFVLSNACAIFRPTEVSTAREETLTIDDPVAYNNAQDQVNEANRLYLRGQYDAALAKTNESLSTYETFEGYYLKGTILYKQGEPNKSIEAYEKAERLKPTDQQLLLTMGTVYTSLGDMESAQERYIRLHETYPDEPVYAYKVGTTYKHLRDYEQAYTYLKKADQPGFEQLDQVYLQLGDVALELKRYDESREYFEKARRLNPNLQDAARGDQASQVAAKLDAGNEALQAGRAEEALEHYNEAKRIAPNQTAPHLLAGSALLVLERAEEAKTEFLKVVELDPSNPRGYSMLGSAYHQLSDYRLALETLDRGLAIAPESYEMMNKKGLVFRDREESRKAIDSFHRAVRINGEYLPARRNLAFALLEDKRYVDARQEFEAAAALDPQDEELQKGVQLVDIYMHLDRGDRFVQERRFDAAVEEYNKALAIRDDQPIVFNSMGRAEFARQRYAPAESHFQKALELDPQNVPALTELIRVYAASRQRAKQTEATERLQSLTQNDIRAALALGRIKEDEGNLSEAEAYYKGLLEEQPDESAAIKRRLGYVYYKMGLEENDKERYQQALGFFEKAEELNGQIPELPDTLQIVRENIEFASLLPKLEAAENYFNRRDYRRALPLFEQVYEKLKRPLILVKISNCHIAMGNEELGLQLLQDARAGGAREVEVSEAVYNHLLKKGKVDEARAGFEEIVAQEQTAYYSWYKLGVINIMQREYDDAVENFNRALIYKPDFAPGYIARGVALYETGEKERARMEFEEALKRDRDAQLASFNIGVFYFNENLMDRAQEVFTDLLKERPGFTDARYQLSYIHYREGRLDDAEEEIRACLRVANEARYHHALAQINEKRYEEQPQPQTAQQLRETYQTLITSFPDSRYAEESREKLRRLNPDMRIVQPYTLPAAVRGKPILFNRSVILQEDARIVVLDSFSKTQLWATGLPSAPIDVLADHVIHVLLADQVILLDPVDGSVLRRIEIQQQDMGTPKSLVGEYGRLGVITDAADGPTLTVFDADGGKRSSGEWQSSLPANTARTYAFYQGQFHRVALQDGKLLVRQLQADLSDSDVVVESVGWRRLPSVQVKGDVLYLFSPGHKLGLMSDNEIAVASIPQSAAHMDIAEDGRVVLAGARRLQVFDLDATVGQVVDLPRPMLSQYSLQLVGEDRIVYVGTDRKVRQIDYDGQEIWSVAIPRAPRAPRGSAVSEAFSIFY